MASIWPLLPEIPRYLVSVGRREDARIALTCLRMLDTAFASELLDTTGTSSQAKSSARRMRNLEAFRKQHRGRTLLGVFMMAMLQMIGIYGIFYDAPRLFLYPGFTSLNASYLASGSCAVLIMVVTFLAALLMDKWRRRTSALIGGISMAVCMIVIGILFAIGVGHQYYGVGRWVVIVGICLYVVAYGATWGPGFKIYTSEIHSAETRAAATSLAQSCNWVCSCVVIQEVQCF